MPSFPVIHVILFFPDRDMSNSSFYKDIQLMDMLKVCPETAALLSAGAALPVAKLMRSHWNSKVHA